MCRIYIFALCLYTTACIHACFVFKYVPRVKKFALAWRNVRTNKGSGHPQSSYSEADLGVVRLVRTNPPFSYTLNYIHYDSLSNSMLAALSLRIFKEI